ncbi:LOW QUALITY PROTEIN: hypothetical protein IFM46972_00539 [Aspergillus udagawae]|uniref:Uncharacterized protein n=1 Tax=Aspergillus udagawae TaxID=91492 RepID=A0A8H3RFF0_9EURO|nr:LOW QUALITY PROTEIN: hypothetical protein IFM46972_00539 [Aspergillus udagawae]
MDSDSNKKDRYQAPGSGVTLSQKSIANHQLSIFHSHDCYSSSLVNSSWVCFSSQLDLKDPQKAEERRWCFTKGAVCFGPIYCTTGPERSGPQPLILFRSSRHSFFCALFSLGLVDSVFLESVSAARRGVPIT